MGVLAGLPDALYQPHTILAGFAMVAVVYYYATAEFAQKMDEVDRVKHTIGD